VSSELVLDTEVLRRHAGRVRSLGSDVGAARSAVGSADLHGGAFGVLCSFLPSIVSGAARASQDAIVELDGAVSAASTGLTGMAASFEASDERVALALRALTRALDGA